MYDRVAGIIVGPVAIMNAPLAVQLFIKPGARQGDAYEVLGQARKCVRWLRRSTLFDIIRDRLTEEKLVQGSVEDFERLVKRCSPQTARYTVHVVQPGFDIEKIRQWSDESIRLMFLSLYDNLRSDGVDFHVIGS